MRQSYLSLRVRSAALSDAGASLAADLPQRVPAVRDLVLEELAVRQGGQAVSTTLIRDSLVEHLSVGSEDLSLGDIDIADNDR